MEISVLIGESGQGYHNIHFLLHCVSGGRRHMYITVITVEN